MNVGSHSLFPSWITNCLPSLAAGLIPLTLPCTFPTTACNCREEKLESRQTQCCTTVAGSECSGTSQYLKGDPLAEGLFELSKIHSTDVFQSCPAIVWEQGWIFLAGDVWLPFFPSLSLDNVGDGHFSVAGHASWPPCFLSERDSLAAERQFSLPSALESKSFVSGRSPGASLAVWQLLLKGDKHFVNKQGAWGMAAADRGHY